MNEATHLRWQLLALAVLVVAVLYFLAPVLTPFVAAGMFAYLFDPPTNRLVRLGLSRNLAVCIVFTLLALLLVLVLVLLLPYLSGQIATFIRRLPEWFAWVQSVAVPWINHRFNVGLEMPDTQSLVTVLQDHWREAGGLVAGVSKSGLALIAWVTRLVVVPVAFFYLLRDWHLLIEYVHELLPRSVEPVVSKLARESDETLGAFVRGQLLVMIVLGAIYATGLWAVGLDVGPLIGLIAGLISFVPYLGSIVGIGMGIVAALVSYGDWLHLVLVVAVFVTGQLLEAYVLVPRLVGERIGLHPLAVIFAVLAGGELFGFLGVLLALPTAAVLLVVLRYAHERYRASSLYAAHAHELDPAHEPPPQLIVPESATLADPAAEPPRNDA